MFEKNSFVVLGHGPQGKVWGEILSKEGLLSDHLHSSKLSSYSSLPQDKYYVILAPDLYHGEVVNYLEAHTNAKAYIFAHGYSNTFKLFQSKRPCWLVAPKAIAPKLKEAYEGKKEVSVVVDANPKSDLENAKTLGNILGAKHLIEASFDQETMCDLFTEQTLLCYGLPYFLQKSHEFLVKKGIPKNLAATELMEESLLMLELIKERGISGMLSSISTTAAVGASRGSMEDFDGIWNRIMNGEFHQYLMKELNSGNKFAKEFIENFKKQSFDQAREK